MELLTFPRYNSISFCNKNPSYEHISGIISCRTSILTICVHTTICVHVPSVLNYQSKCILTFNYFVFVLFILSGCWLMPSVHQHSLCTSLLFCRSSPLASTTCVVKHNNNNNNNNNNNKKQARSNKQTRQSNTAHPMQSLFL